MKRHIASSASRFFLALATLAMLTFTACEQAGIETIADEEINLALTEATLEASYDEVDDIAIEAMELTDQTAQARTWQTEDMLTGNGCPTLTHDSVAKTVLIDFGQSCLGPDGKTRSGQILVSYTKRLYHPGAELSIELISYSVDSLDLEGTKTIKNLSANYQSNISLETTLSGGKVTWPDGSFATRDFVRTRTWVRAANPIADQFEVTGNVDARKRDGSEYSAETLSTMVYKRRCRRQGVGIPVQGEILIERPNKADVTVDFGNGTCDHLITITVGNQSKTIDVRNL